MSAVGTHTFDMVPGQNVYEVPIGQVGVGSQVRLKLEIREASGQRAAYAGDASRKDEGKGAARADGGFEPHSPVSPSRKLQTALMMRSYLDNHDVLRQMQDLLQDMVMHRPDEPIDYMMARLEEVWKTRTALAEGDISGTIVLDELPAASPAKPGTKKHESDAENSEGEEDSDDGADHIDMPPPPPGGGRVRKCSVSDEAYGAFNQRRTFEKKVIPKDDAQKLRIREVLQQCWMFRSHTSANIDVIVDAMCEKVVEAGVQLVKQGDHGDVMWVVEEGTLECQKLIDGVQKPVKTCRRGDVFGELALLYNCPRAASVVTRERSVLLELDRETFKAICYEAAQESVPEYEGFQRPGGSKRNSAASQDGDPTYQRRRQTSRREAVSAEQLSGGAGWTPPVHAKTREERQQLSDIIRTSPDSKLHMLFGNVNRETFEKIVDAMCLKKMAKGEHVIEQWAVGDFFYIVKAGGFDIFIQKGNNPPDKVFEAGVGFAFGELALLYNAPRSATITATVESEVWSLDRAAFRNLVVSSAEAQFKARVEFLKGVEVFQVLTPGELAALAEVLEEEEFEDDEAIIEQDEKDDKMFILQEGKAMACIKGEQGEVEVMEYHKGNYFGEIALLTCEPRKASVYAMGHSKCLYISRQTFLRILGPLTGFLERNMGRYEKYQDAISKAATEPTQPASFHSSHAITFTSEDEEEHTLEGSGLPGIIKRKKLSRKRERPEDLRSVLTHVDHELPAQAEPETLADKVAQDFRNPALVNPAEAFLLTDGQMSLYGGVAAGQKFVQDKTLFVRSKVSPQRSGNEEIYSWQGPTILKQATDIAVVCQKGQKSKSDPTPNQDNFFIHHVGNVTMYGVTDGHGPFGHLVSFRVVQTLPYFITKNKNFGKDWDVTLKEAFLSVQADLLEFCSTQSVNVDASGASCTVLVLQEQTVHIAFIGDSRVMLGSWNRRDTRMIFCSKDHKPELPDERQRLEAAGSEVREVEHNSYRIYLPGSTFPGLTMSRAFGDTACSGVLREPEYHKVLMQPTDQWYCIVASDGIWEFLEGESVCDMTAKKLRLKGPRETLSFLVNASRKRWNHCCGDYCDDITAILVQWNAPMDNRETNHSLTVNRPAAA